MAALLAALRTFSEPAREFWNHLSRRRQVALVVSAVAVFGGVWMFRDYMVAKAFRPLFTELAPEEAGVTVARLKQLEIPYRLTARGSTIMVPEQHLDEARLQLATEKLPRTGRQGFEIFDQTDFGATEFSEHVNFRRALEGELERTLLAIDEIESARVHISLPKRSVFLDDEEPAKASVVLELRRDAEVEREQVRAIAYLVASAVEGLNEKRVVVVDTGGAILAAPRPEGSGEASSEQIGYQREIEKELRRKILATLEPYVGFDRSRASVVADIDWNAGEQTEEIIDPDTVVMTTQRSEELTQPADAGGIPGTASNLPRQPAMPRTGARSQSRTMETTNYQTSRTVTNMHLAGGQLKRLSVAVVVDQVVFWDDGESKLSRKPRSDEEMDSLRSLVVAAAGINEGRGDLLTIANLPYTILEPPVGPPPQPEGPVEIFWLEWIKHNRYNLVAATVVVVLLIGVFAFWNRRRKKHNALRRKREAAARAEQSQKEIEAVEEATRLKEAEEARLLQGLRTTTLGTTRSQVLKKHLEETAAKDPEGFVQLLRTWIHEDED